MNTLGGDFCCCSVKMSRGYSDHDGLQSRGRLEIRSVRFGNAKERNHAVTKISIHNAPSSILRCVAVCKFLPSRLRCEVWITVGGKGANNTFSPRVWVAAVSPPYQSHLSIISTGMDAHTQYDKEGEGCVATELRWAAVARQSVESACVTQKS